MGWIDIIRLGWLVLLIALIFVSGSPSDPRGGLPHWAKTEKA